MLAPGLAVLVLTTVAAALRLALAGQSLFADELSTYYIVSTSGLGEVVATVHGNAEITPPLHFVSAWLATRIDLTPEWLRAPSLVAGTAMVPLTYLLGVRTVGREAGLVAAALTAVAPLPVAFSTEARAYELTALLVVVSTLALLAAVDTRRARWWVAYAACSCAAVYSHYVAVFVLAAQLAWVLVAHAEARRAAVAANAGAALGLAPWATGLLADLRSPTTDILSALEPFGAVQVLRAWEHWSIGYPLAPFPGWAGLPGYAALALLGAGLALGLGGLSARRRAGSGRGADALRRPGLIATLALSSSLGAAIAGAAGMNLFTVRTLSPSWPAFALALAALLVAAGSRLRFAAAALAVAAFAVGGAKLLEPRFRHPDYDAAAAFIDRSAAPGDVVIDALGLSPAPVTAMEVALRRPHPVFAVRTAQISYRPFRLSLRVPSPAAVARRAAVAAAGRRLYVVSAGALPFRSAPARPGVGVLDEVVAALPPGYRTVQSRAYPGIVRTTVTVLAMRPGPRR